MTSWRFPLFLLLMAACNGADKANPTTDAPPPQEDVDQDGFTVEDGDCNDADASIHPDADEVCDGLDNNCDQQIDEGVTLSAWVDADEDGFGAVGTEQLVCELSSGLADNDADCDDTDHTIHPDAQEICDTLDNDCDAWIDEADDSIDPSQLLTAYSDADQDGFGDAFSATEVCSLPPGTVDNGDDCDDSNPDMHPDADEICDGLDNDCDHLVDDLDPSWDPVTAAVYYIDTDGDQFGDPTSDIAACEAPASYVVDNTDCDDTRSDIRPTADEVCDGLDNDCDGDIDDADSSLDLGTTQPWYADTDSDTFGDPAVTVSTCVPPSGFVADDTDCVDNNAAIHPDAQELCDTVDNDCDGHIDDDDASLDVSSGGTFFADADNDGFGTALTPVQACLAPPGFVETSDDCLDTDPAIHPDAEERCDGIDNDCDTAIDDADPSVNLATGGVFFVDLDGDTFGDPAQQVLACERPQGHVENSDDCDDRDGAIHPDATEICDGLDNDCDRALDDADPGLDSTTGERFFSDADQDGFGDPGTSSQSCLPSTGTVRDATDCDDTNPAIHPTAMEVCDTIDNDCDQQIDDADPSVNLSTGRDFFADVDLDNFGDPSTAIRACVAPTGFVDDATDCDDDNALITPQASEVCDGVDNNCDRLVDDADPTVDLNTGRLYFEDADEDLFGDPASGLLACDAPRGFVINGDDCDDQQPLVHPDALEVCDTIDNDCDQNIDDADDSVDLSTGTRFFADRDGDRFGDSTAQRLACLQPGGYVVDQTDCDDNAAAIYPGAAEICDTLDNDCDQLIDDGDSSVDLTTGRTFYTDGDGDTFGDVNLPVLACVAPTGTVLDATDCNDADDQVHPDATEVCDTLDNDCDTLVDDDDTSLDGTTGQRFFEDADGDLYGSADSPRDACGQPIGFVDNSDDCDDLEPSSYPGGFEVCDGLDNDCDRDIDNGTAIGMGPACSALSCLDIRTRNPAAPDGSYFIDPEQDGVSIDLVCNMTSKGGGWTLVHSDTFDAGVLGPWTRNGAQYTTTTVCGTYGSLLGGYGELSQTEINVLVDLQRVPHTEVQVDLDYIFIDSWDHEAGYMNLDGTQVWIQSRHLSTGSRVCGRPNLNHWLEDDTHVSEAIGHTASSIAVRVGSTLNESPYNESFAIDNFEVWVR